MIIEVIGSEINRDHEVIKCTAKMVCLGMVCLTRE